MGFDFVQKFPGGANNENNYNVLRINIKAMELANQNLNPKDKNHIIPGPELYSWSMVAPTDIQEAISHTWEDYSSIQGRLAQIITDTKRSVKKVNSAVDSVQAQLDGGASLGGALSTGNTDAARYKIDSPLVYTGSNRREYSFTFPMMIHKHIGSAEVAAPIHEFRKYSCAVNIGTDIIDFPAIFSIESWPQPFIYVKWAALTDIQVTYSAPYRYGNPQRAELTLTFRDIRPLYRNSYDKMDALIDIDFGG